MEANNAKPVIQNLLEANPLREPVLRSIIETLKLPRGSHGLDSDCGIGLQALLLAEAVGAEGHVTGLDILLLCFLYLVNVSRQGSSAVALPIRTVRYGTLSTWIYCPNGHTIQLDSKDSPIGGGVFLSDNIK